MAQGIIYLVINKQNGHKYVGQTTKSMNKKWQEHITEALKMSPSPLHRAMRKYGNHNFMVKEIDECDESLLDEKEQYWIEHYNSFENNDGYNEIRFKKEIKKEEIIVPKIQPIRTEPWGFMLKENRGNGKHTSIRVLGINIETGEEKIWESFTAAALEITGNKQSHAVINMAAKKGTKAYGYRWRRLDNRTNKTPIRGVHKRTWAEIHFESIIDACRYFGTQNISGIKNSLKNSHKYSWKGYYWFYN